MIKTRLLRLLKDARKYVVLQVLWQWLSLLCQILIIWQVTDLFSGAYTGTLTDGIIRNAVLLICQGVLLRFVLDRLYTKAGYFASVDVKRILRKKIYEKLLRLGASYREKTASSQVVQMATKYRRF